MQITVWSAESETDYGLVANLQGEMWSRSFFEGMRPFSPQRFAKEREQYWIELVRPLRTSGHSVLLARASNTPCGYCHSAEVSPSSASLAAFMPTAVDAVGVASPVAVEYLALGVLEKWRRLGVARALLEATIKKQGGPFGLWVARKNEVARRFYHSLGWREEQAVRSVEGGVEEIRMQSEKK